MTRKNSREAAALLLLSLLFISLFLPTRGKFKARYLGVRRRHVGHYRRAKTCPLHHRPFPESQVVIRSVLLLRGFTSFYFLSNGIKYLACMCQMQVLGTPTSTSLLQSILVLVLMLLSWDSVPLLYLRPGDDAIKATASFHCSPSYSWSIGGHGAHMRGRRFE
jgi:hypothetical protein